MVVSNKIPYLWGIETHNTQSHIKIQTIMATTTQQKIDNLKSKLVNIEKGIEFHNGKIAIGGGKYHTDRIIELQGMAGSVEDQIKALESGVEMSANLVEQLKAETTDLLELFIEQTRIWAPTEVARNVKRAEAYRTKKITDYKSRADYYTEQKWYHRTPGWFYSEKVFTEKAVEDAAAHYQMSIEKLAIRIFQKGLQQSNITVTNGTIGVNISATVTDGIKTVRAFSIVASGMIQRPHYRFLVK